MDEKEAINLVKLFAGFMYEKNFDDVIACFIVGSLASHTFVDGVSDIDISVILSSNNIKTRNDILDFTCIQNRMECFFTVLDELRPPFEGPEKIVNTLRIKCQGKLIYGSLDTSQIAEPSKTEFRDSIIRAYRDKSSEKVLVHRIWTMMRFFIYSKFDEMIFPKRELVKKFATYFPGYMTQEEGTCLELAANHKDYTRCMSKLVGLYDRLYNRVPSQLF